MDAINAKRGRGTVRPGGGGGGAGLGDAAGVDETELYHSVTRALEHLLNQYKKN